MSIWRLVRYTNSENQPLCDTPLIYYASIMGGTMILVSMMHYINEIIIKKKWIK